MTIPDLDTTLVRSDSVYASEIDGEVVMADFQTDAYYGLDVVSSRIWNALETPRTLRDVCQELIADYNVDEATCHEEVLAFAKQLLDAKIASVVQP